MLTWKVAWWPVMAHTGDRPFGGGFVPGVDWLQAVDNARAVFKLRDDDIVHCWSQGSYPS